MARDELWVSRRLIKTSRGLVSSASEPDTAFSDAFPDHVRHACLVVDCAGEHEQKIAEPVHVYRHRVSNSFAVYMRELDDQAFGAPADGARQMEMSGRRRTAGEDELKQGLEPGLELVDRMFEMFDVTGGDGAKELSVRKRIGKCRADQKQLVLKLGHQLIGGCVQPARASHAKYRVQLVDRAVRLDPEVGFEHAAATEEACRAVVAGLRINLHCSNLPGFGTIGEDLDSPYTRHGFCR